jgi:hypothetical protein
MRNLGRLRAGQEHDTGHISRIKPLDAMSALTDLPHVLRIQTRAREPSAILVAVRDSDVRAQPEAMERPLYAFYTTKLRARAWDCRVSARSRRQTVEACQPRPTKGTTFQLAAPIGEEGKT